MSKISQINKFISNLDFDTTNKEDLVPMYVTYSLIRTQSMFEYTNLPPTIPKNFLEMYLQCSGKCMITNGNDNLYAFTVGLGGKPNE